MKKFGKKRKTEEAAGNAFENTAVDAAGNMVEDTGENAGAADDPVSDGTSTGENAEHVPLVECDSLVKLYKTDEVEVFALQGLDLTIEKGELMAIIGKSGSGKSTLLNIIGALEHPSAGRILINGQDISKMSEKELVELRRHTIGFVWQKSAQNLFPYMTARENIEAQLYFEKTSAKVRREKADKLLEEVGLLDKADSYPHEMSGGEQQRVAIAVSLVKDPDILLADEPTGAVDTKTSENIQNLFRRLNRERGITIIIVTHDISLANKVDRVVMISDGKISTEKIMKEQYKQHIDQMGEEYGLGEDMHEEFTVLDKAGRLKLTEDIREEAGILSNRVKIEVKDGKIIISNAE